MQISNHTIQLSVTGADMTGTLKRLTDQNIFIYDVVQSDELSASFFVRSKDLGRVKHILEVHGDRMIQNSRTLSSFVFLFIRTRYVFLFGCIIAALLSVWIPSRIFFIEVYGNNTIPKRQIQEIAALHGLDFGALRADVRSEAIKNTMLSEISELDWVGITTAGCVATVEVKEKPLTEKERTDVHPISSIVASCDGVIEEITVTNGTPLCKTGQAVREGQVLISGYEDCGFLIKASRAQGEVIAQTMRHLEAVFPLNGLVRGKENSLETKYSMIIGKNIINFNNNSGISPPGCVKIYEEKYLTLPGGFMLPVAIVKEKTVSYDLVAAKQTEDDCLWVDTVAQDYIENQILAGKILRKNVDYGITEDLYSYSAWFICREQIGKNRVEESLRHYGKDS